MTPPGGQDQLPRYIVVAIALAVVGLLIYNVIADVQVNGYEGSPTTLMLGGLLGGLLGLHRFMGGGKE